MAVYRVRDRKGGTLTVHSKEQADYWAGFGYKLVEDEKKPEQEPEQEPKATARRRSAKKSD